GQAMVLNSLGGVYQRQRKFDDAVEAFRQSYDLSKNERGQAMVLNSLGGVYQRQRKFDDAVEAFRQSYDLSKNERGQAMVLNSLGGVYQRQGKFEEAVRAFQESYDIGKTLGDERHLAMVTTSWGRALLKQNNPEQALDLLEQGFTIDEKMKNRRGLGMVTPLLCQTLRQLGRAGEAAVFCKRALNIVPKNEHLLVLQKDLERPQLTGTVKFVRPARYGDQLFGYITMDDGNEDVRFDSRYVDITGLETGSRVAVEVNTNRWGSRVARSLHILAD
ncbi:MAG: tetratricopeptide repeat protein, partial [Candidatus Electrothrix sp. AR5]|nr:tetratricopeptide repeat protein [Candidatus Electrothrix sp. AR5]